MFRRIFIFILVLSGLVSTLYGFAAQALSRRSVWIGVYSADQTERGKAVYARTCVRCHGINFDGLRDATILGDFTPRFSLRGSEFMERWREDTAYSLFRFIKIGMPPR